MQIVRFGVSSSTFWLLINSQIVRFGVCIVLIKSIVQIKRTIYICRKLIYTYVEYANHNST